MCDPLKGPQTDSYKDASQTGVFFSLFSFSLYFSGLFSSFFLRPAWKTQNVWSFALIPVMWLCFFSFSQVQKQDYKSRRRHTKTTRYYYCKNKMWKKRLDCSIIISTDEEKLLSEVQRYVRCICAPGISLYILTQKIVQSCGSEPFIFPQQEETTLQRSFAKFIFINTLLRYISVTMNYLPWATQPCLHWSHVRRWIFPGWKHSHVQFTRVQRMACRDTGTETALRQSQR